MPNAADKSVASIFSPNDAYNLRLRSEKTAETITLKNSKPVSTTIAQLSVTVQKKNLWTACRKMINKPALIEGAFVFAKQTGYAPWPSTIVTINKSRTSAVVKYLVFSNYTGTVKLNEIVQVDMHSADTIGALIEFTLKTKAIKEYEQFKKAIKEVQAVMQWI